MADDNKLEYLVTAKDEFLPVLEKIRAGAEVHAKKIEEVLNAATGSGGGLKEAGDAAVDAFNAGQRAVDAMATSVEAVGAKGEASAAKLDTDFERSTKSVTGNIGHVGDVAIEAFKNSDNAIDSTVSNLNELGQSVLNQGKKLEENIGGGARAAKADVEDLINTPIATWLRTGDESALRAKRQVESLGSAVKKLPKELDDVQVAAGLSVASLAGFGAVATAVQLVTSALSEMAAETERVNRELLGTAARADDIAAARERLVKATRTTSAATGLDPDDIAKQARYAYEQIPDQNKATAFVDTLARAQAIGQGNIGELSRALIPMMRGFEIPIENAESVLNTLFVTVKRNGGSVTELAQSLGSIATRAKQLGVGFEESLSFVSSSADDIGKLKDSADGLVKSLTLLKATDANADRKQLAAYGVEFDRGATQAERLLNFILQVQEVSARNPGKLDKLLGKNGSASDYAAILGKNTSDILNTRVAATLDTDLFARQFKQGGDAARAQYERIVREGKNKIAELVDGATSLFGELAGKPIDAQIRLELPENLDAFRRKIATDISQGNFADAQESLQRLNVIEAKSDEIFDRAAARAKKLEGDRLQAQDEALHRAGGLAADSTPRFDRAAFDASEFDAGLSKAAFTSRIKSFVEAQKSAVRLALEQSSTAATGPVIDPSATADRLRTDLERTVAEIGTVPVVVEAQVVPEDIQKARDTLAKYTKELTGPNGERLSSDRLDSEQKAELTKAIGDNDRYRQSIVQAQRISLGIDVQTAGVLERNRAQHALVLQSIVDQLDALKLEPAVLEAIKAKLPALAAEFDRLDDLGVKKAGVDLQEQALAARGKSLETERDLARQSGQTARANQLGFEIIRNRTAQSRTTIQMQRLEAQEQYGNDRATLQSANQILDAQDKEIQNAEKLAIIAERRAQAERARATAERVEAIRSEASVGLDAEIERIRAQHRQRRAEVKSERDADGLNISDAEIDAFYKHLEDRDIAYAKRQSTLFQGEAIARALGEIDDSLVAQFQSIELVRRAERTRMVEALDAAGAEQSAIDATTRAYDLQTQKLKAARAIQFANQSAASIAEQRIQQAAVDPILEAFAPFDQIPELVAKAAVEAATASRNGGAALYAGWKAGIDDTLRDLNDLRLGVQASQSLLTGFRDSVSTALEGVGSKSANAIGKDFLRANLENIRRQAAAIASAKITRGIFGDGGANDAQSADVRLNQAGEELYNAGLALSAAATDLSRSAADANFQAHQALPQALGSDNFYGDYFQGYGAQYGPSFVPAGTLGPDGSLVPSNEQQGPNADGTTVSQSAEQLAASGTAAGAAMEAGARRAGAYIGQGGRVFLSTFLGGAGNKLGEFLTDAITGAITPATTPGKWMGGRFRGRVNGPTPRMARLGGVFRHRTTLDVSENPGLEEAVIPLHGGAVPIEIRGGGRHHGYRSPVEDMLAQLGPDPFLERVKSNARDTTETAPGGAAGLPAGSRAFPIDTERLRRVIDSAPTSASFGRGGGPVASRRDIHLSQGDVHVTNSGSHTFQIIAPAGASPDEIARIVARQVRVQASKSVAADLMSGRNRELVDAVREVAGGR